MTYLDGITAANFDWEAYVCQHDPVMLLDPRGRRVLTKLDPLLFGLLYFQKHLRSGDMHDGPVTLADFHLDMCRRSYEWIRPGRHRAAEVAPRDSGKSTWNFLLRPMWALAHRHRKYVSAFADSGPQAEQHLLSFKQELDENELLRLDHPGLCTPKKRVTGVSVSDTKNLYVSRNDQIFSAKGIDSSTLGAKVGNQRPDLILFDDIEPDASNYTEYQKDKRAHSMIASVLPMNLQAAVIVSGTVTMAGSVVHDLVRTVTQPDGDWKELINPDCDITQEDFEVHYYPAIVDNGDGTERSVWPEKWPMEFLKAEEHKSSFQLNFMNDPIGRTGGWWTKDDFHYGCLEDRATQWMLQLDPAVTTKEKSDYTGIAVIACAPPGKETTLARCEIKYARGVKLVGEPLRRLVLNILEWFPRIAVVRVEANQGGETWHSLLHDIPAKVQVDWSSLPKEIRLAQALDHYQRPGERVLHHERFVMAEQQAISYPNVKNDDIIDAIALGLNYFLGEPKRRVPVGSKSKRYAR
jgi:hypothetical protein